MLDEPLKTDRTELWEGDIFDPNQAQPSQGAMISVFNQITIPAILTNLLFYATIINDNIFAGHMGDPKNIAVVGLTNACS